jgi:hypothetical protein
MDLSDRGFQCGNEQIEAEFFEEVRLLGSLLYNHKIPIPVSRAIRDGKAQKFVEAVNRAAHALTLWELFAIPWRIRGEKVYIIHAPRDVNGSPVIHELDKKHFIEAHMRRLAEAEDEVTALEAKQRRWSVAFFALAGVVVFTVFFVFQFWRFKP